MKGKRIQSMRYAVIAVLAIVLMFGAGAAKSQAAAYSATATTDRHNGICTYKVQGLDLTKASTFTMMVKRSDNKKIVLQKDITLDETNCVDGVYTGTISLQDVGYDFTSYSVHIVYGTEEVKAGVCDFSVHQSKLRLSVAGGTGDAVRTFQMVSSEAAGGVLAPGSGNQVSIQVWNKSKAESTAKTIGTAKTLQGSSLTWKENIATAAKGYGTWGARLVLNNTNGKITKVLSTTEFKVEPTVSTFTVKKSAALEKQAAFQAVLSGLNNAYAVKKVTFQVYNSKGKKVYTVKGSKKSGKYLATIKLKKLKYKLDAYTIKAVITDGNNLTRELDTATTADERIKAGTFQVTAKKNATSAFKLTGAYIPGNIKKVTFVVVKSNKKKQGTYKAKGSAKKNKYTASVKSESTGKFTAYAYGYTKWGKKVLLAKKTYKLSKKNMGKQGWVYEKYNGKKYRFYYVNNEKQTNLTKVLKLKKGSGKYQIELNRAAGVVTVYLYNEDTQKYDTPVQTFTVSVGRDVSTNAGPGALSLNSSFTPIGNFSICTNGQAVRYPLKPMHEPDGSTVYARWTSHVVGNVYFHSIAVGSQSHYALNPNTYNRLGTPASAGCIRMAVADAKWLYDYMPTGTPVKIAVGNSKKPGPLGKAATIKVTGSIHYDPTDPEVPDSQKKKDYKAKKISGYMTKSGKKVGY